MPKNKFAYICLSCAATGLFVTLLFKVLQDNSAGAVVPIDNLSMVVSIIFSYMIFKKLSAKSNVSIHIIIADTYLCFYGLNLKFTNLCNFT
ncbi:hypothetical protein DWW75_09905 [Ruminococcus sp. AF17-11]|jgi:transporter family protein|nr:hypothetical protein DWW75_09905 [Ruminococcus sp. AF17-11]